MAVINGTSPKTAIAAPAALCTTERPSATSAIPRKTLTTRPGGLDIRSRNGIWHLLE